MTIEWWTIPLAILIVLGIVLFIYMIIAFRRIGITAKKLDYLVEDLSYKSEKFSPTIDSLIKLLNYIDLLDDVLKTKGIKILNNFLENKEDLDKVIGQLKQLVASQQNKNKLIDKKPPTINQPSVVVSDNPN